MNLLSGIYQIILTLREILFQIGVLKRKKLDCFVVSVGNITLGGTGKTPCVEMLAKLISSYGKSVSIISRGYKRKSKGLNIVSDGKEIFSSIEDSGDEPYYLAKQTKNIPVIVFKDRYKAGMLAINKFLSDCLILDDGFQRRYRLYRDLDIVLIDSTNPFGNYKLFPLGVLREPIKKLNVADAFILTKIDFAKDREALKEELRRIKKDCIILESVYKPVCFILELDCLGQPTVPMAGARVGRDTPTGCADGLSPKIEGLSLIKSKKVFLLSSIANPYYFEKIVEKLGGNIIEHLRFYDHYDYSFNDMLDIEHKFKNSKADFLITTEKDAIRLKKFHLEKVQVYSLKIEFEILDNDKDKLVELFRVSGLI